MKIRAAITERYRSMQLPAKAALWCTICNFLQRGIGMLTTPLFTRLLTKEQYGNVNTYAAWESVLTLVVSLSLYKSMMNLYKRREDKEAVLSALAALNGLITGAWLLAYVCFRKDVAGMLGMSEFMTTCLFVSIVFQSCIACWTAYKQYVYDYKKLIVFTVVATFFSSVLSVLLVLLFRERDAAKTAASMLVYVAMGLCVYVSVFRSGRTFYNRDVWRFSLRFCVTLLPHYLSEFVLSGSDKIMINYMCSASDVATYSIAYAVGNLIYLLTNAVNSSFVPYQYQKMNSKEYDALSKAAARVLLLIAGALFVLMLFSREIILVFGGAQYAQSVDLVIPICVGAFFNYMFQLFARVQEYYEKKLTVVIPSILCAALNIALNYVCIPVWGYQAAAYTTLLSYAIFCLIHYLFYLKTIRRMQPGKRVYDIRQLGGISLALLASTPLLYFLNRYGAAKAAFLAVALVLTLCFRRRVSALVRRACGTLFTDEKK